MFYSQHKHNPNNQLCNVFDEPLKTIPVTKSKESVKIVTDNGGFENIDKKNSSVKTSDKNMCYVQKHFQTKLCDTVSSPNRFSPSETLESEDLRMQG